MTQADSFDVVADGPGATARLAGVLAGRLAPGDVVILAGELAAGKTTFVKAAAAALGSADLVTSPTFALAQFYSSPRGRILHVDAYRLSGSGEYLDLGLEEYAEESIIFVEWGEKIAGEFPNHLSLEFRTDPADPQRRTVRVSSSSDRWIPGLAELRRAMAEVVL
jgi:tRNA threonylcarbamoyladenosine biosynthesis protein TsaE